MKYVDYYKVLGVDRSVSQEEISKAYKKLARKYHPDLNHNAGAEAKFKEINEANEVLKDPERRQRYDTLGADFKHGAPFETPPGWDVRFAGGNHPGGPGFGGGFSDFFEAFFAGRGGSSGRGRGRGRGGIDLDDILAGRGDARGGFGGAPGPGPGQDTESELTIELDDVCRGGKKAFELAGASGKRRYEVKIPQGIRSGERIRLAGQGGAARGRAAAGDLYLVIRVAPHALFTVDGDDLLVKVSLPAWDAALGCRVPVPTLDGEVQTTVPPGVSSGQRLRLKGKGLPRRDGGPGDLYAELQLTVPRKLTPPQQELFQQLKKLS